MARRNRIRFPPGGGTQHFTAPAAIIVPVGVEYRFDYGANYKAGMANYQTTPPSGTPPNTPAVLPGLTIVIGSNSVGSKPYQSALLFLKDSGADSAKVTGSGGINLSRGAKITGNGLIFSSSLNLVPGAGSMPPSYMPPNCFWDGVVLIADTQTGALVNGIAILINGADHAVVDGPLILGFDTAVGVSWSGDVRVRNLRLQNKNQVIYDNCHDAVHSDATLHLINYLAPPTLANPTMAGYPKTTPNWYGGAPFSLLSIVQNTSGNCRMTVKLDQPLLFYDTTNNRYQKSQLVNQAIKISVANPASGAGPCGTWWGTIVDVQNPSTNGTTVSPAGFLVLDLNASPTEASYAPAALLSSGTSTGPGAAFQSTYGTLSQVYLLGLSQCPGTALSVTNTDGGAFSIGEWFNSAGGVYLGAGTNHVTVANTGQDGNAGSGDQLAYTVWLDSTAEGCVYANSSAQSSFTGVRVSTNNTGTSAATGQKTNKISGCHINGNGANYGDATSSSFGIGRALDCRTGSLIVLGCTTSGDIRVRSDPTPSNGFTHLELGPGDYTGSTFLSCDVNEIPNSALGVSGTIFCASGAPPLGLASQFLVATQAALFPVSQQRVSLTLYPNTAISPGTTWLFGAQSTAPTGAVTLTLPAAGSVPVGLPLTITTRTTIGTLTITGGTIAPTPITGVTLNAGTSISLLYDATLATWFTM